MTNKEVEMEKKPAWLKVSYNKAAVDEVSGIMARMKLNTVCKEANCPNLGECYKKRTATFMIMGNICTRHCRFCNVTSAVVEPVDPNEPIHLATAVKELDLKHVVITSVTRDDLPDGGTRHFAKTIRAVRKINPEVSIEVPAEFNSRNDLVIHGKKISGNAQCILNGYTLHHGSLLFKTDFEQMVKCLTVDDNKIISKGIKSVKERVPIFLNILERTSIPINSDN